MGKLTYRRFPWVSMHLRLMIRNLTSFSVKPKMTSSLSSEGILTNLLLLEVCRRGCSLSVGEFRA